jgi:xylulose-5-phosphate/fructose-6-phosphate phosphoketolase
MHAYWRAANYLSVGQIYLQNNPLLETPLKIEHIKPRLLGHWGTTTGINLIYVHLNRLIKQHDLNMIYVIGPGHGGPGLVAHSYLEGSYTERYPAIERDRNGLRRLFRQFSWPYGIPSHVAPETPGSIHEGGELGYSLVHAYGAAFDNPDLIVSCIIGDGHDAFRHGRAEQSRPLSTRAGRHVRMFGCVRSSSRDILKKYSSKFQRLNELL